MTFKSGGFKKAIDRMKYDSYKPKDDRTRIGIAVARLGLPADEAVRVTNDLFASTDRYAKAVELLGHMRAEKIRNQI